MEGEPGLPGRKRPIDWSPEVIRRFWNYLPTTARYQELYFSRMVGRGIVRFLELTGRLRSGEVPEAIAALELYGNVTHTTRSNAAAQFGSLLNTARTPVAAASAET